MPHCIFRNCLFSIFIHEFLYTVIWFQTCLSIPKNFQSYLFHPYIGPQQILLLRIRVDLRIMAIKRYSAFPKSPELDYQFWNQFSVIPRKQYWGKHNACFTKVISKSKVGDRSQGRPEGSLFNSYNTEV